MASSEWRSSESDSKILTNKKFKPLYVGSQIAHIYLLRKDTLGGFGGEDGADCTLIYRVSDKPYV